MAKDYFYLRVLFSSDTEVLFSVIIDSIKISRADKKLKKACTICTQRALKDYPIIFYFLEGIYASELRDARCIFNLIFSDKFLDFDRR